MNDVTTQTKSVIVEREIPFPPQKIWRALTQPHLIAEWLMHCDFVPQVDHQFRFDAEWGAVDCRVLTVDEYRSLSYTWCAYGIDTIVHWTLTPNATGTTLRMEQSGFRKDQPQAYGGARNGWPNFLSNLELTLARMD